MSVRKASDNLPDLVQNTTAKREPVLISGKNSNAVLMAEGDWQAVNETLHLLSASGMGDAIRNGLPANLEGTSRELKWQCAS